MKQEEEARMLYRSFLQHIFDSWCFVTNGASYYTVRTSVKLYPIYVNLTQFLCTAPEKIVFLYWICLIKDQLTNMIICSRRGAIRSFVWIEGLNRRLTEYGAYFTLVHNNQPLTCRNIFSIYPDIWQIIIYLYGSILIYLYGSILIYLYGSILIYGSIRPDTYICHCYE